MNFQVKDRNGNTLQVGDMVKHTLADEVHEWPRRRLDFPTMKHGVEMLSVPFEGPFAVEEIVSEKCVRLSANVAPIPIFLGVFLERLAVTP